MFKIGDVVRIKNFSNPYLNNIFIIDNIIKDNSYPFVVLIEDDFYEQFSEDDLELLEKEIK